MKDSFSDTEFLTRYCNAAAILYDNTNEVVFIKDANNVFKYVSDTYKKAMEQFGSADNFIGMSTDKIQHEVLLRHQEAGMEKDELVKSQRKAQAFIAVDIFKRIGLIDKRPIINPTTNNCVGILNQARPFAIPNILSMIYQMHNIKSPISNKSLKLNLKHELTPKQHMVLFLSLNRYSYTEVATILTAIGQKISAGRVNAHLENLRYIFGTTSKNEMIEQAISLGYHLFIPRQFLKVGIFNFSDEIIISE